MKRKIAKSYDKELWSKARSGIKYIILPTVAIKDKKLKRTDILVFSAIITFNNTGIGTTIPFIEIAKLLDLSPSTIRHSIKRLKQLKYIKVIKINRSEHLIIALKRIPKDDQQIVMPTKKLPRKIPNALKELRKELLIIEGKNEQVKI